MKKPLLNPKENLCFLPLIFHLSFLHVLWVSDVHLLISLKHGFFMHVFMKRMWKTWILLLLNKYLLPRNFFCTLYARDMNEILSDASFWRQVIRLRQINEVWLTIMWGGKNPLDLFCVGTKILCGVLTIISTINSIHYYNLIQFRCRLHLTQY